MTLAGDRPPAEVFFLKGRAGRLFASYTPPRRHVDNPRSLILVPPFAEEMNKSRRMMALIARSLAEIGVGVAVFDLFGTGESEGDFADSRYEIWVDDVHRVIDWCAKEAAPAVDLLGLRFGALLALDVMRRFPEKVDNILFWQPVLSGQAMMNQFLRLRLAASMMDSSREKESTKELRARLRSGESLEVAGYELAPALVDAIESLRLESLMKAGSGPVYWFELVANRDRPPPLPARKLAEQWNHQGLRVVLEKCLGEPFWTTPEISIAPELLNATTELYRHTLVPSGEIR